MFGITRYSKFFPINYISQMGLHSSARKLMGVKPQLLKMPALSPTMTEGTIIKWLKKEGDAINPGDALCDIQTDKAVMAFEVEEAGILAKILAPDDSKDVKIGTVIALLVEEGENWKDVEVPSDNISVTKADKTPTSAQSSQVAVSSSSKPASHVKLGPAAKTLLDKFGLELSNVQATGPQGILLKGDILNYVSSKGLKPVPTKSPAPSLPLAQQATHPKPVPKLQTGSSEQSFIDVPNTNIRQVIARRLTESKTTIPHSYCTVDCRMNSILQLRKQLQGEGIKLSVNDFIIKAVAVALNRVPEVNAQWINDGAVQQSNIDVSVAVATDAGLITPIIKDAYGSGISDISKTMKELSDKARKGKLQPHEFIGGTFTVSNLGMFGISEFSAIINPPQSAIMAVGTSRLVLNEEGKLQTKMMATLSFDNRVFDQSVAARFLEEFALLLDNPSLLLAALGPKATLVNSMTSIH